MQTEQFRMLIRAGDFDATVAFWRDALQLEQVSGWERDDSSGAILTTGGNSVIVIIGGGATNYDYPPQDAVYSGIQVDDVDAWYERLREMDVTIESTPNNKMWGLRAMGLRDPNGVYVYLFTPQEDAS